MKKIKLISMFAVMLFIFSCKKDNMNFENLNKSNSSDLLTEDNSTYGNWLVFSDRDEYVTYLENINDIYENESNPDSILNLLDNSNDFVSMRQFYNDTLDFDFPESYDSVVFVPGILASVTNKHSIYQIGDTIIRIGKNHVFIITDGDVGSLSTTDDYFDSSTIDEELLPSNIQVFKVHRSGSMDEIELLGESYNKSYTVESDYWVGSKTRYKLVATYTCYSYKYPIGTSEYSSSSKFEMGKRNILGNWKWTSDWAMPLVLNTDNYYNMSYGNVSINLYSTGNLSNYGGRVTLIKTYKFYPYSHYVIFFNPIDMHSYHKSVRAEATKEIDIYEP